MNLDIYIEGLLFYKGVPQSKTKLCRLLEVSEADLTDAIKILQERLLSGATRLLETETEIQLVTATELAPFIAVLRRQDLTGDIGKAGAETLSIILYKEPVSRIEIDRIRGVNSAFILRNLMTRGLITRQSITGNGYRFSVAPKLLQHLGVARKQDLPQFSDFMNTIDAFDNTAT